MQSIPADGTGRPARRLRHALTHPSSSNLTTTTLQKLGPRDHLNYYLISRRAGLIPARRPVNDDLQQRSTRHFHAPRTIARLQRVAHSLGSLIDHREDREQLIAYHYVVNYTPGNSWAAEHVSQFVDRMTGRLKRRGIHFDGIWVFERGEEKGKQPGLLHYHVVIVAPRHAAAFLPHPDERPDKGVQPWVHGDANVRLWNVDEALAYVAKSRSKAQLPANARKYGTFSSSTQNRQTMAWAKLPKWAREVSEPDDNIVHSAAGLFSKVTGEVLRCPIERKWVENNVGWRIAWVRRGEKPKLVPLAL